MWYPPLRVLHCSTALMLGLFSSITWEQKWCLSHSNRSLSSQLTFYYVLLSLFPTMGYIPDRCYSVSLGCGPLSVYYLWLLHYPSYKYITRLCYIYLFKICYTKFIIYILTAIQKEQSCVLNLTFYASSTIWFFLTGNRVGKQGF